MHVAAKCRLDRHISRFSGESVDRLMMLAQLGYHSVGGGVM